MIVVPDLFDELDSEFIQRASLVSPKIKFLKRCGVSIDLDRLDFYPYDDPNPITRLIYRWVELRQIFFLDQNMNPFEPNKDLQLVSIIACLAVLVDRNGTNEYQMHMEEAIKALSPMKYSDKFTILKASTVRQEGKSTSISIMITLILLNSQIEGDVVTFTAAEKNQVQNMANIVKRFFEKVDSNRSLVHYNSKNFSHVISNSEGETRVLNVYMIIGYDPITQKNKYKKIQARFTLALRGLASWIIFVDEAAHVDQKKYDISTPIVTQYKNKAMLCFSTPNENRMNENVQYVREFMSTMKENQMGKYDNGRVYQSKKICDECLTKSEPLMCTHMLTHKQRPDKCAISHILQCYKKIKIGGEEREKHMISICGIQLNDTNPIMNMELIENIPINDLKKGRTNEICFLIDPPSDLQSKWVLNVICIDRYGIEEDKAYLFNNRLENGNLPYRNVLLNDPMNEERAYFICLGVLEHKCVEDTKEIKMAITNFLNQIQINHRNILSHNGIRFYHAIEKQGGYHGPENLLDFLSQSLYNVIGERPYLESLVNVHKSTKSNHNLYFSTTASSMIDFLNCFKNILSKKTLHLSNKAVFIHSTAYDSIIHALHKQVYVGEIRNKKIEYPKGKPKDILMSFFFLYFAHKFVHHENI